MKKLSKLNHLASDPELLRAFLLHPAQVESLVLKIACNPCRHGFEKACFRMRGQPPFHRHQQRQWCHELIKEKLYEGSEHVAYLRRIIARSKAVPCLDCKKIKHKPEMTFDHLPQFVKCFDIGKVGHGVFPSIQELVEEIGKCQVVCRACHDKREDARKAADKAQAATLAQALAPLFQLGAIIWKESPND